MKHSYVYRPAAVLDERALAPLALDRDERSVLVTRDS